ncbi:MAG: hypothetical protein L0H55_09240 [Candidatus Nitrosocosmicus sp.]|nr:hypothetical protein [Candidatus Nitrosocosmicus sp.]
MSFQPDDDPDKSSSPAHYSRVGSVMDWVIVLGASSSISFGFSWISQYVPHLTSSYLTTWFS